MTIKKEEHIMKRILAICIAILMMLTMLSACGEKAEPDSESQQEIKTVSLPELLENINTKFDISAESVQGLEIISTNDDLYRKYMISEEDIKQFGAERSSSKTDYMELVLVEANDEDALTKIVNQMSSRLDAQLSTARSYNPESVALLENCKVKTIGNYIYLVISEKQEEIEAMIEEALE